jgi:Ca2+-binding EF-hand superfamily protein
MESAEYIGAVEEVGREKLLGLLLEMDSEGRGRIKKEEFFRLITTVGNKLTRKEAAEAISLLPAEDGHIDLKRLVDALY